MFSSVFKSTICALLLVISSCHSVSGAVEELVLAEQMLLRGNHQEGLIAFRNLAERFPVLATLGQSRCLIELGQN